MHTVGHASVYEEHILSLKEQLTRELRPFPTLKIARDNIKNIKDFNYEDFILMNYKPHPSIKMNLVV